MAFNEDSRVINTTKNATSAFINKMVILLISFATRKFFINYIGIEYVGINSLFSNVLTILSLADLGLGTAMNVSLYKPIANRDNKKLSALLNYYKKLYNIISISILTLGFLFIPFLKYIVNMDKNIPHLYLFYVIYVVKTAISYLFVYKSSIIRADQKTYKINRIEVFLKLIVAFVQLFIVVVFKSYLIYVLLDILVVVAHNLIVSHVADKEYPFIKNKEIISTEDKNEVKQNVFSMFLYKVSFSLLNGTDNLLISILISTIHVGLYNNYLSISGTLESFIALFFNSLTASIGNLVAVSSFKKRYNTFKIMQMFSFWICGVIVISLTFLMQDFVGYIWLSKHLMLDKLTFIAIILNLYFSTCMRPVWTYREGTGMYRDIKYIMIVTAILNLIFSIVLGKLIGLSGILFATVLSKITTYFWYEPYVLFKKFFNVKPIKYYIEFFKNLLYIIVCSLIVYGATFYIDSKNLLGWILKAIVILAISNLFYFVIYRKTPEFNDFKNTLFKFIKRK